MNFIRLLWLILKHGKLKHSGYNFNTVRFQELEKLSQELGINFPDYTSKKDLPKGAILRNLYTQAAYVKNALKVSYNYLNLPDKSISYIRIPKSASTSIGQSILSKLYPDLNLSNLTATALNFLIDIFIKQNEPSKSHSFFTICRNPYARIVSVYQGFFESKEEHFLYEDYLFGVLKRTISFQEFLQRIQEIPPLLMDQHFRPQHLLIDPYKANGNPVTILKLEDIETPTRLLDDYGLNLTRINASQKPAKLHTYFNKSSAKIVQKVYENDFKMLGYSFEIPSL